MQATTTNAQSASTTTIRFEQSPPHLSEFNRLVEEQYGARGWLEGGALNQDDYDRHSDVLTVHDAVGDMVAGMRIVRHSAHGFPHLDLIPLKTFDARGYYEDAGVARKIAETPIERMAEITRLVGKKSNRYLTYDLAKVIYHYAKAEGVDLYIMVIDNDFLKLCTALGIPIHPIGESVFCEGSMTTPAVIDPSEFPVAISGRNKNRWDYIAATDNLQGKWRH